MFCACTFHGNSMNNLLSYSGLVDAKIGASDKDLPVQKKSWNIFCRTLVFYQLHLIILTDPKWSLPRGFILLRFQSVLSQIFWAGPNKFAFWPISKLSCLEIFDKWKIGANVTRFELSFVHYSCNKITTTQIWNSFFSNISHDDDDFTNSNSF